MSNVVVLGCGRSGTSMVAGLFAAAGHAPGRGLFAANAGNPRGLFESREVNRINESILAPWDPRPATWRGRILGALDPRPHYRGWLARVPVETDVVALRDGPRLQRRIRRATAREPFCLKDPRFAYTLELWRPALRDALLVCVFREPERTVESILRETRRRRSLTDPAVDARVALEVWCLVHRWILERQSRSGRWLFVHADQILEGSGVARLEAETGARLDRGFADPALQSRLEPGARLEQGGEPVEGLYRELCKRAGWEPRRET